jgi:Ser/Thr protein kinase RdoA (MazF antagonist)
VSALPSERDQNFLLETRSGERFVLKIANALEDPAFLEAQHQVLGRLAGEGGFCPRVLASRSGAPLVTVTSSLGAHHLVRLVTYLPGTPLAHVKRPAPELLHDLGRRLGIMDRVLASFDHPACRRTFHWDLAGGVRVVREHLEKIAEQKCYSGRWGLDASS